MCKNDNFFCFSATFLGTFTVKMVIMVHFLYGVMFSRTFRVIIDKKDKFHFSWEKYGRKYVKFVYCVTFIRYFTVKIIDLFTVRRL